MRAIRPGYNESIGPSVLLLSRTPMMSPVSSAISTQCPLRMLYELLRQASSGSEGTGVAFSSGDGSSDGSAGLRWIGIVLLGS